MKILIDRMPEKEGDCLWSEWYEFPGRPGHGCYKCKLTGKKCNKAYMECDCLKVWTKY